MIQCVSKVLQCKTVQKVDVQSTGQSVTRSAIGGQAQCELHESPICFTSTYWKFAVDNCLDYYCLRTPSSRAHAS